MKKFISGILFLFFGLTGSAQKDDSIFIREIANYILLHGRAYDDLRDLTKKIGGRLSGSPQMVMAEKWGMGTLKAANADNVWLQECMVPHWIRGGKDRAVAKTQVFRSGNKSNSPVIKLLDVLALGNSTGTGVNGISADVIEIKNFEDLERKKDFVKGKIVFYNYPFNQSFINTLMAYRDAVDYRTSGPSRASAYGASAVIVRSMSESTDNIPHTGTTTYNDSFAEIPAVAIGLFDADWLSLELNKTTVKVTLNTNGHFLPDTIGHNVIGELKGNEFPNEFITLGGHLDSWDPGEGAHDDGAGVVQTIEVLRTLKALGYKPKHTLRFVLFANEENGTRGGEKYAEEAKTKGEKQIFALESDHGGFTPRGFGFTGTDQQFRKFISWQTLLSPYGGGEIVKGGGGSDIEPLAKTQNTPVGSLSPDSQRYFDIHHTRNDIFENVNKRELELGAVNITALIYLIDKYGL